MIKATCLARSGRPVSTVKSLGNYKEMGVRSQSSVAWDWTPPLFAIKLPLKGSKVATHEGWLPNL